MVTHGCLLHNAHLCLQVFGADTKLDDPDAPNECLTNMPLHHFPEFIKRRKALTLQKRGYHLSCFSWLPVYHDMGLVGFFCAPFLTGFSTYLMSPLDFIRRPHLWLQGVSRFKCGATGAPNFGFELVTRAFDKPELKEVFDQLDLSGVAGFCCGAEPIRASTVNKFVKKFASKGVTPNLFVPAYGMAENTLFISGRRGYDYNPLTITVDANKLRTEGVVELLEGEIPPSVTSAQFVGCGGPPPGVEVRIVDPETLREVPPGRRGEIWCRSASTAGGYFNLPEKTAEAFRGQCTYLNGELSKPHYLRTGDSGFFHQGEIFVAGRIKDMIIVRGRNLFPQDIEEVVEEVAEVRKGCSVAFALDVDDTEQLALCVEIKQQQSASLLAWLTGGGQEKPDYHSKAKEIAKVVSQRIGIPVYRIWLVKPRSVRKTTSGKVRRSTTRDLLLDGKVSTVLHDEILIKEVNDSASASTASPKSLSAAAPPSPDVTPIPPRNLSPAPSPSLLRPPSVTNTPSSCVVEAMGAALDTPMPATITLTPPRDGAVRQEQRKGVDKVIIENAVRIFAVEESVVDFHAPIQELGVSSIKAVEFAEAVSKALGLNIDVTILFSHQTLDQIADFLVEELEGRTECVSPTPSVDVLSNTAVSDATGHIAIIGAACRLPGGISSLAQLWDAVSSGKDAIEQIPASRWDIDEFYHPNPDAEARMYVREGGFIKNAEMFDNGFFRVSDVEAKTMDPQQRILLEVCYESLNSAGLEKKALMQKPVGVFVGCCSFEWSSIQAKMGAGAFSSYTATSAAPSILANRISYILGIHGPSMTVDTACSSSLVAIDSAASTLRKDPNGCKTAVAAAINTMLNPHTTIALCKARFMAPDARCKTFDAAANGYVRGEGAGAIVLKRLDDMDSKERGRLVLAMLRGACVNHGGRAVTLTAPNGIAQQNVIKGALKSAGLQPNDVDFLEAHGTGTALGDPIEVAALKAVFAKSRRDAGVSPLAIGAVKTHIGHLEGAAGMAGVLKTICCLQMQRVPPNLHLKTLNPNINTEGFPVVFPSAADGFQLTRKNGGALVAGVSSFGFGGTNAHVILSSPFDAPEEDTAAAQENKETRPRVAFLFTGQGSQYVGMGKDLYETDEVFRANLDRCAALVDPHLPRSMLGLIYPQTHDEATKAELQGLLSQARYQQPILFSLGYSLAQSLIKRGVWGSPWSWPVLA
ncbi:unnamed protein product [Vitrella brassicaformis CCMP3155]|uniref:Uncharacterized protein n=3 Tax=Vitrella brassicaformis TaxID=1169539 RepID=A0A0G4EIB8_VITBC|nr:unnamed protein product [Vitrella brassicaformis CCMP3155]|eukprot:CEL96742.1 unnamed protein product [Vitrella brassicaformis CCMP3155]